MTSDEIDSSFRRVAEACMFTGTWRRNQKPRWRVEARATSFESHISSVGRSVVGEAVMAACVHDHDLKVKHLRRRVGDSPELTAARVNAWLAFG